jgi:hypothetical protein
MLCRNICGETVLVILGEPRLSGIPAGSMNDDGSSLEAWSLALPNMLMLHAPN